MTSRRVADDASVTYAVELTPPGRAAVAVVLVDGPIALAAVEKSFAPRSGQPLRTVPLNRIVVGHWGGNEGEELVLARRDEKQIEVHCHGGAAAVRGVLNALVADGCQELGWRNWLKLDRERATATSSGVGSRWDAVAREAQIALASALTFRAAAILVDQVNGAFTAAIRAAIQAVHASNWGLAAEVVRSVLQHRDVGLHLSAPWRVVLAGPPNVGKSSLINALAGFQRAIVSPLPGTTRDVVTLTTAIGGWPVELADTAGLRTATDELETAGVALTETALAAADLVIRVHDATQASSQPIDAPPAFEPLPQVAPRRMLQVFNKVDLLGDDGTKKVAGGGAPARDVVYTSAMNGDGIAELAAAIETSLVPEPPAAGAAVPFTPRQVETLVVARNAIERRHAGAARQALQALLAD